MIRKALIFSLLFLLILASCSNSKTKENSKEKKLDSLVEHYQTQKFSIKKHFFDSIQKQDLEKLNPKLRAKIYFNLGSLDITLENFEQALKKTNKAENFYKQNKNLLMLWKCNVNKGIIYTYLKRRDSSLACTYKALDIAKKLKNKKYEAQIYANLAHIYFLDKDYDKALKYLLQVADVQKSEKLFSELSSTYHNIGLIYKSNNKLNKTYEYYKKSIHIKDSIGDEYYSGEIYTGFADVLFKLHKNPDTIFHLLKKALAIKKAQKKKANHEYAAFGNLYLSLKKLDSADYYYRKALKITHSNSDKKDIVNNLIKIEIQKKDIQKIQNLYELKDSIILEIQKQKNKGNMELMEQNHQLNIKKINLEAEKRLLNKNVYMYWLLTLLILTISVLFGLTFIYKNTKTQKEKMVLEQKVLQSQLNPHFIFNSLTALQNSLIQESPIHAISYLSRFAKLIRKGFTFISKKNISLGQEIEFLEEYVKMQNIRRNNKIDFEINIDKDIDISNVAIPPLLLQPIIENSFEHGFNTNTVNGKITLNIKKEPHAIYFSIIDNGTPNFKENKEENREHALSILKKRLDLFNKKTKTNFKIKISENGTVVSFSLDLININ